MMQYSSTSEGNLLLPPEEEKEKELTECYFSHYKAQILDKFIFRSVFFFSVMNYG